MQTSAPRILVSSVFDSLQPPVDLASARARLLAVTDGLIAAGTDGPDGRSGSVVHLDPTPGPGWQTFGPAVRVVVADLVLWPLPLSDLRTLVRALGPDRSLVFLEPSADAGWRLLANRAGRGLWRRSIGHDFETDVPAHLRQAGLMITDLNRFGVGPGQVRSYVLGRAVTAGWP